MRAIWSYPNDQQAFSNLVAAYANDYPAQVFCGTDSTKRPCVVLHFDDLRGNQSFATFFFSSDIAAHWAFELLQQIDDDSKKDLPF